MRQLAYVDEAGQVRIRDLDLGSEFIASEVQGSSDLTACAWPTWSPDGSRLAFVRYELNDGRVEGTTIQVTRADGLDRMEADRFGGIPIYFNWAPNGQRIAMLIQEDETLALRVIDLGSPGRSIAVARGTPLHFTWQSDSRGIVAHVGGDVLGSVQPRLLWIRLEGGEVASRMLEALPAAGFRAPSWQPRSEAATVAIGQGGRQAIMSLRDPHDQPEPLFSCGLAPAFVWSADGRRLIYSYRSAADGPYEGLWLFRADTRSAEQISRTTPLAFFWCDERRVVFTTGPVGDRSVGVRAVDVETGKEQDHGFVRPSRDVMLLFGHFDQYAGSARLVSPEGDELVLAASRAKEQENGSVPTVRQILVRRLSGVNGPADEVVGRGRLAFWRPGVKRGE